MIKEHEIMIVDIVLYRKKHPYAYFWYLSNLQQVNDTIKSIKHINKYEFLAPIISDKHQDHSKKNTYIIPVYKREYKEHNSRPTWNKSKRELIKKRNHIFEEYYDKQKDKYIIEYAEYQKQNPTIINSI